MCGIVGYTGTGAVGELLVAALYNLEYRGYDSAGVAVRTHRGLKVKKGVGQVAQVERATRMSKLGGDCGIGHTRWATHGKVSEPNAHPHVDCTGKLAVVHNGIIENADELRAKFDPKHEFKSETDTELIAHIAENALANLGCTLAEAANYVLMTIRGACAFAVIHADNPGVIVGAKREMPLVVGESANGVFLCSDPTAIAGSVSEVVVLDDEEVVEITPGKFGGRINVTRKGRVHRHLEKVSVEGMERPVLPPGIGTFMAKEMAEQPQTLQDTLENMDDKETVDTAMDILRADQVVFVACGTSRYAAMVGRLLWANIAGKFCEVIVASEHEHFLNALGPSDMIVAISQSGETADVLDAVRASKKRGVKVLSLVNGPQSSLVGLSDRVVLLKCGPEFGVAATKSFTSQLGVLTVLAYAMRNDVHDGQQAICGIAFKMGGMFDRLKADIKAVVARVAEARAIYFIGRGINFPVACEGALKLKELAYLYSDGLPAGELKHGPLALVEDGTPVVAICPDGDKDMLSTVAEVRARGAFVIGVTSSQSGPFDAVLRVPPSDLLLTPMLTVVPLQMLAHDVAVFRGHNPDRPRNLAKSVTVR